MIFFLLPRIDCKTNKINEKFVFLFPLNSKVSNCYTQPYSYYDDEEEVERIDLAALQKIDQYRNPLQPYRDELKNTEKEK